MFSVLAGVLLLGCHNAPADAAVTPRPAPEESDAVMSGGYASAVAEAESLLSYAEDTSTAETRQSAQRLAVTCPYARGSWQLALAIQLEVERIDLDDVDPAHREDWQALRRGLAAHVATMAAMGVELRAPAPGDHLAAWLDDAAIQTRDSLARSATPVRDTDPLLMSIDPIVQAYPPYVERALSEDYDRLNAASGGNATLAPLLGSWQQLLLGMLPGEHAPGVNHRINEMVSALKTLTGLGC